MCSQCSTIYVEFNKIGFMILQFLFDLLRNLQFSADLKELIRMRKRKSSTGHFGPRRPNLTGNRSSTSGPLAHMQEQASPGGEA